MDKKNLKGISLLLVLVMLFTLCPLSAFAAEDGEEPAAEPLAEESLPSFGKVLNGVSLPHEGNGDPSGTSYTIEYYNRSGDTLLASEEVAEGEYPTAVLGPTVDNRTIIAWTTQPFDWTDELAPWTDEAILPLFERSIVLPAGVPATANAKYYALYAPQYEGLSTAVYYLCLDDATFYAVGFETLENGKHPSSSYIPLLPYTDPDGIQESYNVPLIWRTVCQHDAPTTNPSVHTLNEDTVFYGYVPSFNIVSFFSSDKETLLATYVLYGNTKITNLPADEDGESVYAWADEEGVSVQPMSMTITTDTNFYAVEPPEFFTVTYLSEDGSETLDSEDVRPGEAPADPPVYTVEEDGEHRYAYDWYTESHRGGLSVTLDEEVINGDISYFGAIPYRNLRVVRADGTSLLWHDDRRLAGLSAAETISCLRSGYETVAGVGNYTSHEEPIAIYALKSGTNTVASWSLDATSHEAVIALPDGAMPDSTLSYTAVEGWSVRYYCGDTLISEEIVEKGSAPANAPASCLKDSVSCAITGWQDKDGNPMDLSTAPDGHLEVYAVLGGQAYTVSYYDSTGSTLYRTESVESGKSPVNPPLFEGVAYLWYEKANEQGETLDPLTQTVTGDISFYGRTPQYSVSVFRADGTSLLATEAVRLAAVKADYTVACFLTSYQDVSNGNQQHNEDIAIYALKDDDGTLYTDRVVDSSNHRAYLQIKDFEMPYEDVVLTAVEGWSVLYYAGDAVISEEIVQKGSAPSEAPSSCKLNGKTFPITGWQDEDGDPVDLSEAPDGHLEVYAVLDRAVLTVTYYDQDGTTVLATETVADGAAPAEAPTANKSGKTITNWLSSAGSFVNLANASVTEDCSYTAWYSPGLNSSEHIKYINGLGSGLFAPSASLTRAQASKILYSLLATSERGPYTTRFSDVSDSAWYGEAVYALASYKILTGYSDGTFKPNNNVTRAEFVTMLSRLYALQSGTSTFTDVSAGKWYYEAVSNAVARGWVNGYTDGSFKPLASITRAEAVAVVNRVLGRSGDKSMINGSGYLLYTDLNTTHWAFYDIMEASIPHQYNKTSTGESWRSYDFPDCGLEVGLRNLNGNYYYVVYADSSNTARALMRYSVGVHQIGSYSYYIAKDGCAIPQYSAGVHELGGKLYLFRNNYSLITGPLSGYDTRVYEYNNKMYYIKTDASLARNEYIGYLYFDKNGAYTSGNATIDAFCDDVLYSTIHNTSLTQEAKLNTAYKLLRDGFYWGGDRCRGFYRNWKSTGVTDWSLEGCAARMISSVYYSSGQGCYLLPGDCYHWSSLMVCLMRRLGYDADRIHGGVGSAQSTHCWEVINWPNGSKYMFDVELEWGYRYGWYQTSVANYDLYMMNYSTWPTKSPWKYTF